MKYISSNQSNYNIKQLNNLSKKFNVPTYIIKHLFSLNIKTEKEIADFFNPGLSQFYNPFLLKGMQEAVNKINDAISNNKKIIIVGDYDTDGICATAVLYKYFESINVKVDYFLPNRFLDGYGLTIETAQKIIENFNPDLLITVDCGISCHKEIDYLLEHNVDVVVTDHHEVPDIKPNCICLDPKDPIQTYPFKELCGAGVALKLVHALGGLKQFLNLTNIASLATVADIVPLVNENRAIVMHGLNNQQNLPEGIKKLLTSLKITNLTSTDIAYKLAPKLNTAGRMGDATLAFKLFIEKNQNLLNQILTELENQNNARVEAGNYIFSDAINMLESVNISLVGAIVLKSETWHSGVLGIVCAKLTEKYNRPVCLLTKVDNEYKGSIRSVNGIDIYKELSSLKHLLVKFGGHAGAGGLTILEHNIVEFISKLNQNILNNYPKDIFNAVTTTKKLMFNRKDKEMKYHFKVGRGKNIIVNGDETFEDLGLKILAEYNIFPDHLFLFTFSNGEETNSASPFGPFDDYRDVAIDSKIKRRKMEVGEVMTFVYDYARDWTRKVKLVEIV